MLTIDDVGRAWAVSGSLSRGSLAAVPARGLLSLRVSPWRILSRDLPDASVPLSPQMFLCVPIDWIPIVWSGASHGLCPAARRSPRGDMIGRPGGSMIHVMTCDEIFYVSDR